MRSASPSQRLRDGVRKPGGDEVLKRREIGRRERDAGRHGVAAALERDAGLDGGAHGAAEVGAGDRAAEPTTIAVAVDGEAKAGRRKRSFSRAATRPTMPGCQSGEAATMTGASGAPSSILSACASASATAAFSIAWRSRLSRSSSRRDAVRPPWRRSLSSRREPSAASPMRPPALMRGPTRKPRCQHSGALGEAGGIEERREAEAPARAHDGEALAHEGAVEAMQRHHVGDRRERDEIEAREQVGLGSPGPESAPPQARG